MLLRKFEMLCRGFASGCFTKGTVWQTQLSALSSYAPIRIWKIDPFGYCPNPDSCGLGNVHFKDVPGAFTEIQVLTWQLFYHIHVIN